MEIDSFTQRYSTLLQQARSASTQLRLLSLEQRNRVLRSLRDKILKSQIEILEANQLDTEAFKTSSNFSPALLDRLVLSESRVQGILKSLKMVEECPDPLGQLSALRTLPNGLTLQQRSDSFGVIFFIFESRPNVITEAFSLGFKSGNVLIFKNGKEAQESSRILYRLIEEVLTEQQVPKGAFTGLPQVSREEVLWFLKQDPWIDLVIPRGGDHLIETVKENSRIPVIQNDRGLCHLFVDKEADLPMALKILRNGKTQRPGVCNSLETLLVHREIAQPFLQLCQQDSDLNQVQWWVCPEALKLLSEEGKVSLGDKIRAVERNSYDQEYLSLQLNIRVVGDLDEALAHIQRHGSKHSEAIITENESQARRFQQEVDAAVVYWNASTRFTDGVEFGLGGEIGISTQKLHVRGPVGLEALTTRRWIVDGQGQTRQ